MVSNTNFETVAVSELCGLSCPPDGATRAPYLFVVEDEHAIADSLGTIFRRAGYAVAVAYDAESALEMAELAPPELVVADVGLPGMNGVDLALQLQESVLGCRIIFVTGVPEEAARLVAARSSQRFRIFAKPVQPEELLHVISELLESEDRMGPQRTREKGSRTKYGS